MSFCKDDKVKDFKEHFCKEAETIVTDDFPKKIIQLDELLKSDMFQCVDLTQMHMELNVPVPDPILVNSHQPDAKRRKLDHNLDDIQGELSIQGTKVILNPGGMVTCNTKLTKIIEVMKPEIRTLVEKCNMLKMWVQLLIPRIEDGNNFGVSIQEDTLGELRQYESEAAAYLDQISRYFITRGKLVSKVAKYPHVEDYRRAVEEMDEKEFISLRLVCCELRNSYAALHDLIVKNIEKIKMPRTNNTESLY
ncbi:proteasome activator complex subunit 3-like isoform X1 [Branchiostoma floridae x Branchiostoma japonicum]